MYPVFRRTDVGGYINCTLRMKETDESIFDTSHRPWILPSSPWTYYQEWNNALFLHWKASLKDLLEIVPKGISLDTFNGDPWISIVAFTMEKISIKGLPSISTISNFHEINVRTYVIKDNKPGVYFLNIEAQKQMSAWIAKSLSGLPYEKAIIKRKKNDQEQTYISKNKMKGFNLDASFIVGERFEKKSQLDKWLIERYCLYHETKNKIYRYEIHHSEWQLNKVESLDLKVNYKVGKISFDKVPTLAHYSDGVKVLTWKREYLR